MAIVVVLFLVLPLCSPISAAPASPSPYLSPSTFDRNHNLMIQQLKIFIYQTPPSTFAANSSSISLFHARLLRSPFLTTDPNAAHLFYLPFPASASVRSVSRHIQTLRSDLPFWNRSLGADHFFLSDGEIHVVSVRNILELCKNSIQITSFPSKPGRFIPHKDLTLPPPPPQLLHHRNARPGVELDLKYLAFYNGAEVGATLEDLRGDPACRIETSTKMGAEERAEVMGKSRFCLYFYGRAAEFDTIGEAMGLGCVPVVVADVPVLDLPFNDVIRWLEVAVFARGDGIRRALGESCDERYARLRELAVEASVHLRWSTADEEAVERRDAFHTAVHQLWLRRHVIRYARRGASSD